VSAVAPLRKPFGLRFGADAAPVEAPATTKARPRLVIVAPPRSTAGRLPFLILIGAVLVSGLLMLLMLHTLAAQDGFKVNALQTKLNTLTDTEQGLAQQVQQDSSPAKLRKAAAALGMVPSTIPSYKRVHGRVVGVAQPAYIPAPAASQPKVNPKTPGTTAVTTGTTATAGTTTAANGKATSPSKPATTGTTTAATHHHKPAAPTAGTTSGQATSQTSDSKTSTKHHKPTTGQ
jgi:cell division protein FtsI (penicillin-binding protein 3)